jgi:hypothetical protein
MSKMDIFRGRCFVFASVLLLGGIASEGFGVIINVPADQATIQAAAGAANPGDEIVIAVGTYSVDIFPGFTPNVTVRGATGDPNDVIMDGTTLGPMFLVAANDVTIRDLKFINADNAVFANSGNNTLITNCIFDSNVTSHAQPSAIALENGTKTVSNCVFINNSTGGAAGAMTLANCDATITGCQFIDNHCGTGGSGFPGPHGGGAITVSWSTALIEQCLFDGNSCENALGGAVRVIGPTSTATVRDCTFVDNTASSTGGGSGGAVGVDQDSVTNIDRCGFYNNTAAFGGAVSCGFSGTDPTEIHITNSVFSGNEAIDGPAIIDGIGGGVLLYNSVGPCSVVNCSFSNNSSIAIGGLGDSGTTAVVTNCVFAGNSSFNPLNSDFFGGTATYCMFESVAVDGTAGAGCLLGTLPNFVDADGADNIVGTPDDDLHLADPSPGVDAGDSTAPQLLANFYDFEGALRFANDGATADTGFGGPPTVDIGAHEVPGCPGDASGDGVVDVNDISYVLFRLGDPCAYPGCDGDVNGDGVVDVNDISAVVFALGNPC